MLLKKIETHFLFDFKSFIVLQTHRQTDAQTRIHTKNKQKHDDYSQQPVCS